MGFQHIRIGHAGHQKRSSSSSCTTGGFYKQPTTSSSINALEPLSITWDTSCLTPANNKVDIYLYAPQLSAPRLHLFTGVSYSDGSYNATLMPRWWNATSSISLQLLIIQSGDAPFLATLPAGPVFTATYSAPSSGDTPASADVSKASSDTGITNASPSSSSSSSHLSKGKLAAAVLMPLLVAIAIAAAVYIYIKRKRGKEKRKRWSEKVDQRMSVVSADWSSMSPAGASAAIRNSMAINRLSSFSFSNGPAPPSQIYDAAGPGEYAGQAGIGAVAPGGGVGGFVVQDNVALESAAHGLALTPAEMSQLRPGLRSSAYANAAVANRVSRVSFAIDPAIPGRPSAESRRSAYERPSVDSRRSAYERRSVAGQSRAFHSGFVVPPMPEGAVETVRASMFVGGVNPTLNPSASDGMRTSHMNVSSDSVAASRMSRFDEVYGDYSYSVYADESGDADGAMSPTQTAGPVTLSAEDIKKRVAAKTEKIGEEDSDVGPALSMMRAQEQEANSLPTFPTPMHYPASAFSYPSDDPTLFSASPISPSFPVPTIPGSPIAPSLPMSPPPMAPPAAGMSPDDMLRAYAERNKAGSRGTPSPVAIKSPLSPLSAPPITLPTMTDKGARPLLPAGPGSFSPARGAYGVSGEEEEIGRAE